MDLALNNLQRLICHKTHQTKPNQTLNNDNRYMKVTLRSKLIGVARWLILADYHEF